MAKVLDKKYLILGIMLGILLIVTIIICSFSLKNNIQKNDNWIVRTYDDTVVLLNNGEVIEVFSNIALDTLPEEDKLHLEKGIPFQSKNEAMLALEDYDG